MKSNDSALTKSFEMYPQVGGIFRRKDMSWTFPSGARIEFGHMQYEADADNYRGGAYHRVAWDELTEFTERQYVSLFANMRRQVGFPLPMEFRAASNPGNIGHLWVRKRFITKEAEDAIRELHYNDPTPPGMIFWKNKDCAFVPSRVADNPSLQTAEYIELLRTVLPPVMMARMLNGDWSVVEDALLRVEYLQKCLVQGPSYRYLLEGGENSGEAIEMERCHRFSVVDTAGADKDIERKQKGKEPSWPVAAIFDYDPDRRRLVLLNVWRRRCTWTEQKKEIPEFLKSNKTHRVIVEVKHWGEPLVEELQKLGFSVETVEPVKDKVTRAAPLMTMMEDGRFYVPASGSIGANVTRWLGELEAEFMSWTGGKDELDDQIDVCAYAADRVSGILGEKWGGTLPLKQMLRTQMGNKFKIPELIA